MQNHGPAANQIVELSCAQLARFRAWFATHKDMALSDGGTGEDASERLEALTQSALDVARQIPADGGACGRRRTHCETH